MILEPEWKLKKRYRLLHLVKEWWLSITLASVFVAVVVLGVGLVYRWFPAGLARSAQTQLGASLLGGALVALAVLSYEASLGVRERRRERVRRVVLEDLGSRYFGAHLIDLAYYVLPSSEANPDKVVSTTEAPFTVEGTGRILEHIAILRREADPKAARECSARMVPYLQSVVQRSQTLLPFMIESSSPNLVRALSEHAERCNLAFREWESAGFLRAAPQAERRFREIYDIIVEHQALVALSPPVKKP